MATTLLPPTSEDDARGARSASSSLLWRRSAPKKVREHCRPGAVGEGWLAWGEHLRERKKPAPLAKLLDCNSWPLAWALPEELAASETVDWIAGLAPPAKRKGRLDAERVDRLEAWLADADAAAPGVAYALESLAIAHALPRLAEQLSPDLWWGLLEHLLKTAREAAAPLSHKPLTQQLLGGELPLTLAYHFPELAPCGELLESAGQQLSAGLTELLDGEGTPQAKHLHLLRPLLALWTRSLAMSRKLKGSGVTREATAQYEWLVRNALRICRQDGSQAFARGAADAWEPDLFAAALKLNNDREDDAAAVLGLPGSSPKERKQISAADLPTPSTNSEWAGLAVLRTHWERNAARLFVDYSKPEMQVELALGGGILFSGPWNCRVEVDGQLREPVDSWQELCWNSDDECDYLELEISLQGEVRIQRQILLAREDRMLYLCDNVLGAGNQPLAYRGALPLAAASFIGAEESREGVLRFDESEQPAALVLPLALPEWRAERRHGELVGAAGKLELHQQATQRNLACPLFFDLDRQRFKQEFTWRQLTVAEKLEIVPSSTAVGYRVQSGSQQWLIYRSHTPLANRTLLAQNLTSEFLCARFDANGDVEELLEIEASEE